LRRVWARSHYEPSTSTYLHNTDFGYLEYDMWEHMNQPPEGETVGLKIRKVRQKEFVILMNFIYSNCFFHLG
jgi:hypothetical protein